MQESNNNLAMPGTPELPRGACCGCGVCAAVCPAQCIDMVPDGMGFPRPRVRNELCVSCRKCMSVCPSLHVQQDKDAELGSYWARSAKNEDLATSSSGGVFGLLADEVLAESGVVYGAAWSEDWRVSHVRACDAADVMRLRKSKYVQSSIGSKIYKSVKNDLSRGKKVLFSGTGCQVAALRSYLGKTADSERLLCVEVICHGVPSPKLWGQYVDWLQHGRNARLVRFSFREKSPSWERYSVRAEFSDGSAWQVPYMKCWYMAAFMNDLSLRQSCYSCPFKRRSGSDIVLGDFWGIGNLGLGINHDEGVSAVVVNTERGREAISCLQSCEMGASSYQDILSGNRSLEVPTRIPEGRGKFQLALERGESLTSLMAEWRFDKSAVEVWCGRFGKVIGLTSECGVVKTACALVKITAKAMVMLARGTNRECLRKMVMVAVGELREKSSGEER